jgi:hypothetical protein
LQCILVKKQINQRKEKGKMESQQDKEFGQIRSEIEGLARRLEELGSVTDADNLRRASAKFYLAHDRTMLLDVLKTAKLILKHSTGH